MREIVVGTMLFIVIATFIYLFDPKPNCTLINKRISGYEQCLENSSCLLSGKEMIDLRRLKEYPCE